MASTRTHTRADGSQSFKVLWREPSTGKQTSMTFPTSAEAETFRRMLEAHNHDRPAAEATALALLREVPTVQKLLLLHMSERSGLSLKSQADYESRMRNHITPHLGAIPVEALTKAQLADWMQMLTVDKGLATRTVSELRAFLSAALSTGVEHGWRQTNPLRGMRVPRNNAHLKVQPRFFTRGEFDALVAAAPPHYRTLLLVLASTGLRWGEATGLDVQHVHLTGPGPYVQVRQALHANPDGTTFIGPVKTAAAVRDVTLSVPAANALHLLLLGKGPGEAVFTGPRGVGRLYHGQFHNRVWTPSLAKAGVGKARIHDLRHTHASWLIQENVHLTTIQRRLGHETIKTTSDLYGHLSPEAGRIAAEAIGRAMSGAVA